MFVGFKVIVNIKTVEGDLVNSIIRTEAPSDYRKVEEVARAAFYREERFEKLGVGCVEHYMVHSLRKKDGITALSLVAEIGGEIVGHIIYSKSYIETNADERIPVINLGPLSVLPDYQNMGVGSTLIKHSILLAKELGYGAIFFFGHPDYYPRFGFKQAVEFGITTREGVNFPAFMGLELQSDYLKNIKGRFIEASIYDEQLQKEAAALFDKQFS